MRAALPILIPAMGLCGYGLFIMRVRRATARPQVADGDAFFLGILLSIFSLVGAFRALYGFDMRCDDACSTNPGWSNSPDAWQWSAQFGLAWLGVVATIGATTFVALRRSRYAHTIMLLALAAWASWFGLLATG